MKMPDKAAVVAKAKILVASHKAYAFPEDPLYFPIRVGCALQHPADAQLCDNTGDHLSEKNGTFCELTALYWAWKNCFFDDAEYAGLVHYRRYFSGSVRFGTRHILSEQKIDELLRTYDVIVPKKRCYYIETVRSHYGHAHYAKDLEITKEIVLAKIPEYAEAFDTVMKQRSLYLYNMFVMRSEHFYVYCAWLFPLLFEAEKRIETDGYDSYQRRVFGFLAERLFNVWLLQNGLKTYEVNIVNVEGENLLKKGFLMLKRKWLR